MKIIETQSLIDYYTDLIHSYVITIGFDVYTYDDYKKVVAEEERLDNNKRNAEQKFAAAINAYQMPGDGALYKYIKLILFVPESEDSFRNTMSLKELLDKYEAVRNGNYDPNASIPDASSDIQEYNKMYQRYSDHIRQLRNNNSRTTVRKYIDKIKEYVKIYINSIKLFNIYNDKIAEAEEEILAINEQIRLLEQTIKNAGTTATSFDDTTWMNKINKALAKYLVTLAEVYKEKVEDRYNI